MSLTKIEPVVRTRIFDAAQHPSKPHLFQCAKCRKWFSRNALQIDHIVPEVESFPDQRSAEDNLQLLCAPKGSTWINSCHKKKTRREAQERARRNKVPRRWMPVFVFGTGTVIMSRFTWLEVFRQEHLAAMDWLQWSGITTGAVFSTYLVQKGWRRRRPRRVISPEPVSQAEPGQSAEALDKDRIIEAFRELVGKEGDVRVVNMIGMDDFTVTYKGTGFEDHKDDKQYEALLKIQAKLNDRWLPWWDTGRDRVRFTRRPTLPTKIHHPGFEPDRPWNILPVSPEHHFDLMVTSHVLIIGKTNAGKTALMRSLTCAVANTAAKDGGTELMLADPKLVELMGFEGWDGVLGIYSEDQELWDMAFDLHDDMMHRYWLRKHKKVPFSEHRRRIVILDEFEEWVERMLFFWMDGAIDPETGKPYKQTGKVSPAHRKIMSVLRMARLCGIHLIIGTQRPDAAWFGGSARDNLEGRAAVGAISADAARMTFGNSSIGRDIPKGLKGRTTFQTLDGTPEEIQAYWAPDPANNKGDNTLEDWTTLVRLGMPKTKLPENVRGLIAA